MSKSLDLEAIRQRNEERRASQERHSSDGICLAMAACCEVGTGKSSESALSDIDALLAEVERLQDVVQRLNPCPACGAFTLLRREGAPTPP